LKVVQKTKGGNWVKLTEEEERMLQGEFGYAAQKSMELQVALGEVYRAEKMARIFSVHITGGGVVPAGTAGALYVEELAGKGGKFVVDATINPGSMDFSLWKEMGVTEECFNDEMAFRNSYKKLGALTCYTCIPYQLGNVPRLGEHIAWSESSAVIFANSVLGARTNREAAPSSIAAAITGRVPLFGYHLDQNRYGAIKVLVSANLEDVADYGALGHFVGKIVQDLTPVFVGIPPNVSADQLKALGATLSGSGSVALFHAVGITPEAKTEEQAFGFRKRSESQIVEFGEKELWKTMEELSTAVTSEVDLIFIGCPHASIAEIKEVAQLISRGRLHPSVGLWIYTSVPVKAYAERAGYKEIIEEAGGKIICETCPFCMEQHILKGMGHKIVATNSGRGANNLPRHDMMVQFGSTRRCVEAAINGIWR
jgi:predicted aconitase